jgi:hypothetical protein
VQLHCRPVIPKSLNSQGVGSGFNTALGRKRDLPFGNGTEAIFERSTALFYKSLFDHPLFRFLVACNLAGLLVDNRTEEFVICNLLINDQ